MAEKLTDKGLVVGLIVEEPAEKPEKVKNEQPAEKGEKKKSAKAAQ